MLGVSTQREPRCTSKGKGTKDSVTGTMWSAEETGPTRYPCPHRAVVCWGEQTRVPATTLQDGGPHGRVRGTERPASAWGEEQASCRRAWWGGWLLHRHGQVVMEDTRNWTTKWAEHCCLRRKTMRFREASDMPTCPVSLLL